MFGRTSLLKATALALPFSLAAAAAQAASVAETVQQNQQLSTFAKAMETAGLSQQLSGQGPYTVFAPTDQAFEQLPQGALDQLMQQDNKEQLTKLLEHHVVQGKAISAKDVLGRQSQVDTMSGDTLTVDGTSQMVLLVPTGLTITRVGDELVIEREGVAVSTRAIQVQDQAVREAGAGQQQQGQQEDQTAARTPTAQESDMPMTEHQQQALESEPAQEQQQTAAEGTADMPATGHQQQVIEGEAGQEQTAQQAQGQGQAQQQPQGQQAQAQQQAQGQQQQQAAARTPTAEESDMPMTEHQEEVLESQPGQEQQQTAPQGATPMPATEHQRQVLAEDELPGEQQQSYEQARVEGKPDLLREATVVAADVQADNGVIHVIDAVLVPQDVLKTLEQTKQGQN